MRGHRWRDQSRRLLREDFRGHRRAGSRCRHGAYSCSSSLSRARRLTSRQEGSMSAGGLTDFYTHVLHPKFDSISQDKVVLSGSERRDRCRAPASVQQSTAARHCRRV